MEIRVRGIVSGERTLGDEIGVFRYGSDILSAHQIRRLVGPGVDRLDFLGFGIVNGPVADEKPLRAARTSWVLGL